ncbi:peptidase M14 [Antarcticibacterium arcticum]|uniref:Peptidase M14 n=1 Tax=Antarcticibacterium arcticum TaxID=2585771 RepID=A0A5B8YGF7_9FLAO|nr:M14 family zinc carboxypeptidase [Antarcticibacterium arcticum]QED37072.1 peptidase M14 [Antarcticibacterium arcticum]
MEKLQLEYQNLLDRYLLFKETDLSGRYLPYRFIKKPISKAGKFFRVQKIGSSALGEVIESITIGNGKIKILAWSQMHGNESTTTKAVFDLVNAFKLFPEDPFLLNLKEHITLRIIPMLNPDGAGVYTRENANKIDLNRDALNRNAKESIILRDEFERFQPDFCFNLHDQRTIFSAGESAVPATVSFLTPAMDDSRAVTPSREISMKVIANIAGDLQHYIPGQIGRYDDAYNANCTGDTFQTSNIPTLLFEAGHYPGDYQRERSREFIVAALFSGLKSIASGSYKAYSNEAYFNIPENYKLFYDVILRKARLGEEVVDVAIQFRESLENDKIIFVPYIDKIAASLSFYGHKEINCSEKELKTLGSQKLSENDIVDKLLLNNEVLVIN